MPDYPVIPDSWQPTAANVNSLPRPLRQYIMELETNCDPSGHVREIWILRQQVAALVSQLKGNE